MSKKEKGEQSPQAAELKAAFTKEQLLGSKRYEQERDILSVVLENDKLYTHEEITQMLHAFLNKEAK